MTELIFIIEEAPESGYTARALGESIFTEAETMEQLKTNIKEAVDCHFDDDDERKPKLIRLHLVKDELITL
jgi:predicted RNase H-like HicB family nuclease